MMKINLRRAFGIGSVATVLTGAWLLLIAAPGNAQPERSAPAAAPAITTAFDLNGVYTDGGSARPRISDVNDILTIDMSSQHRPTATGVVVNSDTILVTFPDDATYGAKLVAPGTIRWSNGSAWQKLTLAVVPDVVGLTSAQATAAIGSAGLTAHASNVITCDTFAGRVDHQSPSAGTQLPVGSLVNIYIAVKPKICQ
jgi:hypothetical protein